MKILVYPSVENPYLSLLYASTATKNCSVTFLERLTSSTTINLFFWYFQVFMYRLQGIELFHLHWIMFSFPTKHPFMLLLSYINTIFSLYWLKLLGYKIVWSAHNVVPHEPETSNDQQITKILLNLADHIIVHSESTRIELESVKGDSRNISVIPHANYIGTYENNLSKNKARNLLKVSGNAFIFLFFGQLREYKGIEELIREYKKVLVSIPDSLLIIKGKCPDPKYKVKLNSLTNGVGKILFDPTPANNDDVQIYFNSADIVVLPFSRISTSGSAVLALSFGKPIIAPKLGSITDLPDEIGYLYDHTQNLGLNNAMITAYKDRLLLGKIGKNGYRHIKQFTWEHAAMETVKVYSKVLSNSSL